MGEIVKDEEVDCPDCDGAGYIVCEFCDGSGKVDSGYRQAVLDYENHILAKMEKRTSEGGQR